MRKYESETRQDYVKRMNRSTRYARRNTLTLHSDGSEVSLNRCKALDRLRLQLDIAKRSYEVRRFSPIFRPGRMSLFTFGSFRNEFRCLEKDLRPSDHIPNDSKPCGRRDKDAGIIEISKHDDST